MAAAAADGGGWDGVLGLAGQDQGRLPVELVAATG